MTRVAFFSGSFDPMTNGHLDVIGQAAALCDRLVAGVASGYGRHAGVDANLVRVVLLVIAVWSRGIGAVLYVALAALLPEEQEPV